MMQIDIHDVDHGGCSVVTGPDNHRLMLDCGLSVGRSWFPSIAHYGERIHTLMLLNLDEDHCEDLSYLLKHCPVGAVVSNPTVTAPALQAMKAECGMRDGVATANALLQSFGTGLIGDWSHHLGGVQWNAFWNHYGIDFTDTNNLSLAVFIRFGGFTILFGGDLERAGWRKLLQIPDFRALLPSTNIYVASHHGRENGCCDEVFELCQPELVIFSDGRKQYETQETHGWYANRARGIPDFSKPAGLLGQPLRRVMTTRRDGTIRINIGDDGRYLVTPSRQTPALPAAGGLFGMPAAKPPLRLGMSTVLGR